LSTERARLASAPFRHRQFRGALLGACALGLAVTLATASSPATAQAPLKFKAKLKQAEHVSKEPFGDVPKGPLQIIVSIDEQQLHLYSNGTQVADALIATGVAAHPTPMGVFSVIEKERFHRSNIYSGAPMPYMQRITWSGVAMHEGVNLGHPASHGCIRLPREFAERLFLLHSVGARVFIARPELRPVEFADPHLFVHKERPPEPVPSAKMPATVEAIKTAQTVDDSRTMDAVGPVAELRTSFAATDSAVPAGPGTVAPAKKTKESNDPAAAAAIESEGATANTKAKADEADPQAPIKQPAATDAAETSKPGPAVPDTAAKPLHAAALEAVPMPFARPAQLAKVAAAKRSPISIFVSRKAGKIYVRQNFVPLFDASIAVDQPQQLLGTHVFTAMQYLDDGATMRWNVISLPGERSKTVQAVPKPPVWGVKGKQSREAAARQLIDPPSPQTPQEALARIQIPPEVIDQISQMIVPGSSLIVSDQGLGEETGESTDFIVVMRGDDRAAANEDRRSTLLHRRADDDGRLLRAQPQRSRQPFLPVQ
jgi:hypothetical protein